MYVVILIRSASNEYPQHMFLWRSKKNTFLIPTLIWSYVTAPGQAEYLGPVVQSIVSLMNLLVVKMLTDLVSTISNSQVFFAEKMWANAKATHIFFQQKYLRICHI